jgi:hypothetical protein
MPSSETLKQKKCGLIMPISAIDGYPASHWEAVLSIIKEALSETEFSVELVSNSDEIGAKKCLPLLLGIRPHAFLGSSTTGLQMNVNHPCAFLRRSMPHLIPMNSNSPLSSIIIQGHKPGSVL